MANKKPNKVKPLEVEFKKLYDDIGKLNFESIDELKTYLNKEVIGKKIDDIVPIKKGKLSNKEKANELMYDAFEADKAEGIKLANKAIKLDADNVDAYIFLGGFEKDLDKAIVYYKKGMEAGKRTIGEKEFEELKGHFWGFHETRPYMKAKAAYAECLFLNNNIEESIKQYTDLLTLNPNDNQGLRYYLANILVNNNKFKIYEKLHKQYKEDSTFWLFTYAIYLFKKDGKTAKADKALLKAYKANNNVIALLTGDKEVFEDMPEFYSPGGEEEANIYLRDAAELWLKTTNAIDWAIEFYQKRKSIN